MDGENDQGNNGTQQGTQNQDGGSQNQGGSGNQGSSGQSLVEMLQSPELKADKRLERFKDVDSVAKSWIEAQTVISKKGVILPAENATPEELGKFYNSLGRPEKAEGYELAKPELPEGMTYNEERATAFRTKAHELGLTQKQMQGLHDAWNELEKGEYEKQVQAVNDLTAKVTADFKKKWGNDYDSNLKKADAAIVSLFGEDFRQMLIETGLNNHPAVIDGMYKASQAISEDGFVGGAGVKPTTTVTYADILSAKSDPKYYDIGQRDPAYVAKVEKMVNEYAAAQGA